ncbi:MAG: class I SAM-dependent methyltransferase [Chitinophagaceae bacterium]|nr:class I SAM-dependent methyltransferase [Chitinophagaceae bacterium]
MGNFYKKSRLKFECIKRVLSDTYHLDAVNKSEIEAQKKPLRSDILNYLLTSLAKNETTYLEIGVRNPAHNFSKINAGKKYSVDPGVEFRENPVDFKLTSDEFFEMLRAGKVLTRDTRFDVVFIDGLHFADQVERDIHNSLEFINDNGFVVLHDCNPPTEAHAREAYGYRASPALDYWSGTTWKGFFKYRQNKSLYSCCIDTDWGVGIISKTVNLGEVSTVNNPFFEYWILEKFRKESLNLISFDELKKKVQ